ncbi:MAG TPA: hypothetical protein VNO23_19885 [Candidatus Binatia bacterium]|nr:hypothetical protein [Candidatus Binatia bacterium]
MIRLLGLLGIGLVLAWVVAHLLFLGPIRDAAEQALAWLLWLTAASAVAASIAVLAFGLVAGRSRPAWLRFLAWARTGAAVIGCGLVLVGLLHYRDTEPRGEIHWIVLGLAVLAGAGAVHWWVARMHRRVL